MPTGRMGVPQSVFSNNTFGFTAGGPMRKNKTFFFAAFQQNDLHSTANYPMQLPTADAVSRLRALFPNNPRLDLYRSLRPGDRFRRQRYLFRGRREQYAERAALGCRAGTDLAAVSAAARYRTLRRRPAAQAVDMWL
jgi:hypothetical protein